MAIFRGLGIITVSHAIMTTTTQLSPTPASRPLQVIHADDMPELRALVRILFQRAGHTVACYANGRLALEHLAADPARVDLLITDHHMPGMNGLELVRQARALAYGGKIIVFSSELSREVAAHYRALQVDRILDKPIFPSDIRRMLGELFPPAGVVR
jgi:CheY-like chemotaxis protein